MCTHHSALNSARYKKWIEIYRRIEKAFIGTSYGISVKSLF